MQSCFKALILRTDLNSGWHHMCVSNLRLGHMRAHSRLESRYSSSSGGSYDEDKSEYLFA